MGQRVRVLGGMGAGLKASLGHARPRLSGAVPRLRD